MADLARAVSQECPTFDSREALDHLRGSLSNCLQRQNGRIVSRNLYYARHGRRLERMPRSQLDTPPPRRPTSNPTPAPVPPPVPQPAAPPAVRKRANQQSVPAVRPRSARSTRSTPISSLQSAPMALAASVGDVRNLTYGSPSDPTSSWLFCPLLHTAFAKFKGECLDGRVRFPGKDLVGDTVWYYLVDQLHDLIVKNKDEFIAPRGMDRRKLVDYLQRSHWSGSQSHHKQELQDAILGRHASLSGDAQEDQLPHPLPEGFSKAFGMVVFHFHYSSSRAQHSSLWHRNKLDNAFTTLKEEHPALFGQSSQ